MTIMKRLLVKNLKVECGEKNIVSRSLKSTKAQNIVATTFAEMAEYCKLKPPAKSKPNEDSSQNVWPGLFKRWIKLSTG